MGLDWWSRDPFFVGSRANGSDGDEVRTLRERVAALEDELRRQGRELPASGDRGGVGDDAT
jgi:hypothetical protein